MATGTAATQARLYHTSQTHYLQAAISYTNNGSTVSLGTLPAGAVVVRAYAAVGTAFNGDTTNTVSIGKSGATTTWASAIALGTRGLIVSTTLATATTVVQAVDVEVIATVTSANSASAGSGYAVLEYIFPQ